MVHLPPCSVLSGWPVPTKSGKDNRCKCGVASYSPVRRGISCETLRVRTPFIVFMLRFVTPLGSVEKVRLVTPKWVTQRRNHILCGDRPRRASHSAYLSTLLIRRDSLARGPGIFHGLQFPNPATDRGRWHTRLNRGWAHARPVRRPSEHACVTRSDPVSSVACVRPKCMLWPGSMAAGQGDHVQGSGKAGL